jgi:RNA polymerase sigma-70 factor (ECF subfamily)
MATEPRGGAAEPQTDAAERTRRFEELIVPEMQFLARIARTMSRSQAEADDLAQETLVKAFRAMESFDGKYPRAWLARIARNTAINRDQRNREFLLSEEGTVEPDADPADITDPEDIVLSQEMDENLRRALDELPPPFRVLVQMVDVEDMSYQEAADALEIPIGTVMSRLHRARNRLRRSLQGTALDRSAGSETVPEAPDASPEREAAGS